MFKLLAQRELFFGSVVQKPTSLCFHTDVKQEYANQGPQNSNKSKTKTKSIYFATVI